MNWKNLKNNKCPECTSLLLGRNGCEYACLNCGFVISNEKFEKIVNDLYKPKKFQSDDDRLSELNNLGRKEVTEDFSDSPFLDK